MNFQVTFCNWCGNASPPGEIKYVNGYLVCERCRVGYAERRKEINKQRLTVPRVHEDDVSNNCDIGYHERCNGNDCGCNCHGT